MEWKSAAIFADDIAAACFHDPDLALAAYVDCYFAGGAQYIGQAQMPVQKTIALAIANNQDVWNHGGLSESAMVIHGSDATDSL